MVDVFLLVTGLMFLDAPCTILLSLELKKDPLDSRYSSGALQMADW